MIDKYGFFRKNKVFVSNWQYSTYVTGGGDGNHIRYLSY